MVGEGDGAVEVGDGEYVGAGLDLGDVEVLQDSIEGEDVDLFLLLGGVSFAWEREKGGRTACVALRAVRM